MNSLDRYTRQIGKEGRLSFNIDEFICNQNISRNYAKLCLSQALSSGDIISPAKGLYVIVPLKYQNFGSIPAKDLVPILTSYLNMDYYVSLLSGAEFYGATHQKVNVFQVITNKRMHRSLRFGSVKIDFLYKKYLDGLPLKDFVVETGYLKVASPELIIFDMFKYVEKSAGLNHIATVLSELIEAIDPDKFIALAKKLDEKSTLQRFGYMLDNIDFMEEDGQKKLINALYKFLEKKMSFYVPLASELPILGCTRSKKWKVIINTDVESDL